MTPRTDREAAAPLTAAWWAEKLYEDLAFAAPELWRFHIERRFSEALHAVTGPEEERQAIEQTARLQDALDALTTDPFTSPHVWRMKARSGAVAVRRALGDSR
jgi:hypothetical protein